MSLIYWPQVAGPVAAQNTLSTDPYFSLVQLLVHFDGTNGSQSWVDSSSHGHGFNSPGGTVTLSTTAPLFGTASLALSGTGVALNASATADYKAGTSDFCIEFAVKTSTPSNSAAIIDMRTTGTQVAPDIRISGGSFRYLVSNVDQITGGTVATSTWQRVAYARVAGTGRLFIDGTQVGSNYTDSNNYNVINYPISFGAAFNGANFISGFIDEFRYTIGNGRYSANYTPATAAFPNV
jgi:hypothetical protein